MASSAYTDGLALLARRELSAAALRTRLLDREHPRDEVDAAVARLLETGALDDGRVARAYARAAAHIKHRGRLRVTRELAAMGIAADVVAEAVAEVFGTVDERGMIAAALQRKLRGRTHVGDRAEYGRLYQYLLRQGFSPAGAIAALREIGRDLD